jgi:hypothetical protein
MSISPFSSKRSLAFLSFVSFMALTGFGPCNKAPAPSTGKEMPHGAPQSKLTPAQRAQAVTDGIAEYKKGKDRDCTKVIKLLASGLPNDVKTPQDEEAFTDMADCAHTQHRWYMMKQAAVRLIAGDKNFAHPAMLPIAEIGMGNYDKAQVDIDALIPKHPKDPELQYSKALISCNQMKWPDCQKNMGTAIGFARTAGMPAPAEKQLEGDADVQIADSLMHLGQLPQASSTLDSATKLGSDPKPIDELRKEIVPAKTTKVVVDEFHQPEIPLGVYHLYGKAQITGLKSSPVPGQVYIYNIANTDRQFRVEAEIVGVTERLKTNVTVLKAANEIVPLVPPLKSGFNVSAQSGDTQTQFQVKIVELDGKGGEKPIYDMSHAVKVLPRDSLLLALRIDEDATRTVNDYIGAWVTPNAKAVDEFLKTAKKRAPKATFAGPQTATLPQVEAIYDELHDRGVSYVMDPDAASETGFAQRTRLPAEVLSSNNAQCLEGAILFATLFEAIGLDPIIVRIPGHAFVGWHSAKDGIPDGTPLFLETTMVHTASYDDAVSFAKTEVEHEEKAANFAQGISHFIEIKALRGKGITPQPYE